MCVSWEVSYIWHVLVYFRRVGVLPVRHTNQSEGKFINVYNLDRAKHIATAPVKNQCSGDYFYGRDERLEEAIQFLEKGYASTLREILTDQALSEQNKVTLRLFWLLQYLRTEAASRKAVERHSDFSRLPGVSAEEFNIEIKEAVQASMLAFSDTMHDINDLKVVLIKNNSKVPFITSDDPAVLSNRWHLYDSRTKFSSFGICSAGVLLFLPLTPEVMCLIYDGDVYDIKNKQGFTSINSEIEVNSFNQHQFLNCRANVFFKESSDISFVEKSYSELKNIKSPVRHRTNFAVFDSSANGFSRYAVVDPSEVEVGQDMFIHSSTVHHRPKIWSKLIRLKSRGKVYTNGTAMGYRRLRHSISDEMPFYKEYVRIK